MFLPILVPAVIMYLLEGNIFNIELGMHDLYSLIALESSLLVIVAFHVACGIEPDGTLPTDKLNQEAINLPKERHEYD
jgi:hypothetical protein